MRSVDALPKTTVSGRRFTRRQLAQVQETVQTFANLSRTELAETVCEHLNWKNPRGRNKINSCFKLLETLEAHGIIVLPAKRQANTPTPGVINVEELAEHGPPVDAQLQALLPIVLQPVLTTRDRAALKASIQAHHYLGYKRPMGAQLAYFVVSQPLNQRLGCLLFSASAAWHLAPRDQWIGWEKKHRENYFTLS